MGRTLSGSWWDPGLARLDAVLSVGLDHEGGWDFWGFPAVKAPVWALAQCSREKALGLTSLDNSPKSVYLKGLMFYYSGIQGKENICKEENMFS